MLVKEFIKYLKTLPRDAKISYGMCHYFAEEDNRVNVDLESLFGSGKNESDQEVVLWCEE